MESSLAVTVGAVGGVGDEVPPQPIKTNEANISHRVIITLESSPRLEHTAQTESQPRLY